MEQIEIKLDFRSKKSISDQVQEEMRQLIQDKILGPGDQLPTVRKLAAQLRVNFNTIARAYRVLDQEGLISTQQGRGTYILEDSEGPLPQPLPTKEEQINTFVNQMLEKASRQDISIEELYTALQKRSEPVLKQQPKNPRKRTPLTQKRRPYFPAWYQEWMNTKNQPGHGYMRRYRKRRIK